MEKYFEKLVAILNFKLDNLLDNLLYLHPYDDSDIKDLISDLSNDYYPNAIENVKRNISYLIKIIINLFYLIRTRGA